jgi:hypothetical protein
MYLRDTYGLGLLKNDFDIIIDSHFLFFWSAIGNLFIFLFSRSYTAVITYCIYNVCISLPLRAYLQSIHLHFYSPSVSPLYLTLLPSPKKGNEALL